MTLLQLMDSLASMHSFCKLPHSFRTLSTFANQRFYFIECNDASVYEMLDACRAVAALHPSNCTMEVAFIGPARLVSHYMPIGDVHLRLWRDISDNHSPTLRDEIHQLAQLVAVSLPVADKIDIKTRARIKRLIVILQQADIPTSLDTDLEHIMEEIEEDNPNMEFDREL